MDRPGSLMQGEPLMSINARVWRNINFRNFTQKRLKLIVPNAIDVVMGNASPMIGTEAKDFFPYDAEHVRSLILHSSPDIVLLCGKEAKKAEGFCEEFSYPYVSMVHPAARGVTNVYMRDKRRELVKLAARVMLH